MKQAKHSLNIPFFSILLSATLSLAACGGGSSSSTGAINSSHPKFFRSKISESPRYEPSGEITETVPTFSWSATEDATEYRFGHESTNDESDWQVYTLTSEQLGCYSGGDTCAFTPTDFSFPKFTEKAWWVQANVNGDWQEWSRPNVFTIVETDAGYNGDIPQPAWPTESVDTLTPEFSWSDVGDAMNYKIGYENTEDEMTNGDSWESHEVDASNCEAGVCSFIPANTDFFPGESVVWWVKAQNSNGSWSNWSEAAVFTINQ